MDSTTNTLNWFEIPANDINRAKAFYENAFSIKMETSEMMGMKMAMFPSEMGNGKASGGLCESPMHKPSMDGSIIYLNANPDMQPVLDRIEAAGGKVLMPKTKITDDIGHMAFFADSEGNKVALHSQN
jgi:predicted enzyme related to lactoylglutathione lyase